MTKVTASKNRKTDHININLDKDVHLGITTGLERIGLGADLDDVRAGVSDAGPIQELSPVELVKGMLLGGTRISLLPALAARRELNAGELSALRLGVDVPRPPAWEITLLRRRNRPVSPAAAALAEVLVARLPALCDTGTW